MNLAHSKISAIIAQQNFSHTFWNMIMNKFKLIFVILTSLCLFSCTPPQTTKVAKPTPAVKTGYLKDDISQAELYNPTNYKRYYYTCRNFETGARSYLSSYFPLSRESRMKDNFGFYFQLDNGKVAPFDHIENRTLNARGTRFEVVYRSYHPIQGSYIDLIARQRSSTYYKNQDGIRVRWLECKES